MYPDDPRKERQHTQPRSLREQILIVLMAVGIALVATLFGGLMLWLGQMFR